MAYFSRYPFIIYLIVIVLITSPSLYIFGEEKDVNGKIDLNKNEDNSEVNYYITIESANIEKVSIVSDGVFLGYTPYTLLMQYDAKVNLMCVSRNGRVLLNTTLEGGKSPQRILILPPNRDTYWKDIAKVVFGFGIGAGIGFAIALLFVDGID
jgi:hypothetical protein